jgi:hypothetical protein
MDPILEPEQLISIHLRLECIGLDAQGRMTRIPGPDPDEVPRVYIAQYQKQGQVCFDRYYREDVPTQICGQLDQLASAAVLHDHPRVLSILRDHFESPGCHYGKSCVFAGFIFPNEFPDTVLLGEIHQAMTEQYDPKLDIGSRRVFGVIQDGKIVSTCQSSRENDEAGEAWVRTLPEYRRRGFARQVTAAWGNDLLAHSKIPFYSYKMENIASQSVAKNLGLIQYITDAAYG